MKDARAAFLRRVREAVAAGNRAGSAAPLPARGAVGYQGAGDDPVRRFAEQLTAAGGRCYLVTDAEAAVALALALVHPRSGLRVLLGRGAFLDTLGLAERLRAAGVEVFRTDELAEDPADVLFGADVGISGADALLAETGSVVVGARPDEPRSLTLLPPVHIVLAERRQLVADLFDLFEGDADGRPPEPPSCLTVITGPSKTGDIELRLVTGVHGPGEVHVILVTG